jgi:hypothetical protein
MTRKINLKITLVTALFFFAFGGWLLHLRIHPPVRNNSFFIPFIAGILSIAALPVIFWFRKTIAIGYILNGFLAIIGTITMAHFSIVHFQGPVTAYNLLMNTLFCDIFLLWGVFALGKTLFDLEFMKADADQAPKGRFFRYPNMGWWYVHLAALSTVYSLGNIFWK